MSQMLDENLIYEVLAVVDEIPEGKVATYGQIARLIGRPKNARLIGRVLGMSKYYGSYSCHRVVNHAGRLAPGWDIQGELLKAEGVSFKNKTHVKMKDHQWQI